VDEVKHNVPTGKTPEVIAREAAKVDAAETAAKQREERAVERRRKQEERELAATLRELADPKEKRSKA
jgi:hypothetical protein